MAQKSLTLKERALHRGAFKRQARAAMRRGIQFLLSFEEWLDIWVKSGKLEKRGTQRGKYVMARFGDEGPYAVGNVKVILHEENVSQIRATPEMREKRSRSAARYWTSLSPAERSAHAAGKKLKASRKRKPKRGPLSAENRKGIGESRKEFERWLLQEKGYVLPVWVKKERSYVRNDGVAVAFCPKSTRGLYWTAFLPSGEPYTYESLVGDTVVKRWKTPELAIAYLNRTIRIRQNRMNSHTARESSLFAGTVAVTKTEKGSVVS